MNQSYEPGIDINALIDQIALRMVAPTTYEGEVDDHARASYDGHEMDVIIARYKDHFRVYEVPEDADIPVQEYLPPSEWFPFLLEEDLADDEIELWHARFVASEEEGMFEVTDIERFSRVVVR